MTNILGINAYHGDSSACLVQDGELVSAVEEERFRRIKHWAGFPSKAIEYCLDEAGIQLGDIQHVAINTDPKAQLSKKVAYTLKNRPSMKMVLDRIKNKQQRTNVEDELKTCFPGQAFSGEVHHVEHHLCHLASSHIVSPFRESIAVSVDGFGDFSSAAIGVGDGNSIDVRSRVYFPHSLGIFYQAMTQFIGFPHYGDEYKVMGLAPYGKPTYLDKMREVVRLLADGTFELNLEYFRHHNERVEYEWEGSSPTIGQLFNAQALENLLGFKARKPDDSLDDIHRDLAHSVQAMYEEAFFNILNVTHEQYGIDQLTLAGGCAMNSVANGKVYRRSPYKSVYIQSAAGDAGGAIGAAYYVANKVDPSAKDFYMSHAYLGPSFDNAYHGKLLEKNSERLAAENCEVQFVEDESSLYRRVASEIAEGHVIGWFQGRMEWGPRALGNRSILGDPRRADMKDILNLKIKRRESFRPFAPSILRDKVSDWFEEEDDVPFMMQVFQINEDKRKEIPAVTHVDGSGRLQTVTVDSNHRYYNLISAFNDLTGVPIVLNTSFNENEPVVCRPEEALECFLRTRMDVLVIGDWLVKRTGG
ncbi:MAG: carbamoyltransferase C-terminal domain-containing protein [Sedimenticola sp.]